MEHDVIDASVLLDDRLLLDRQIELPGKEHGVCIGGSSITIFSVGRKMQN